MNKKISTTAADSYTAQDLLDAAQEAGLLASPALTETHPEGDRLWLVGRDHAYAVESQPDGRFIVRDFWLYPVFGLVGVDSLRAAVEGALDCLYVDRTWSEGYRVSAADRSAELWSRGVPAKAVGENLLLYVQPDGEACAAVRNRAAPWLWDVSAGTSVHTVEWEDVREMAAEAA